MRLGVRSSCICGQWSAWCDCWSCFDSFKAYVFHDPILRCIFHNHHAQMHRGCALVLILCLACGVADALNFATPSPNLEETSISDVLCLADKTVDLLRVVDECIETHLLDYNVQPEGLASIFLLYSLFIEKSATYQIHCFKISLPFRCPRLIQATADLNSCCEKCLRHVLPPRAHRLVEILQHVQNSMRFVRKRVLQVLKLVEFFIFCMKAIEQAFKQHRV